MGREREGGGGATLAHMPSLSPGRHLPVRCQELGEVRGHVCEKLTGLHRDELGAAVFLCHAQGEGGVWHAGG